MAAFAMLGLAASAASAQNAPVAATKPVVATAQRAATATAAAKRPGVEVRVIEDDQVRIEETRLRGQLQRITVAPKGQGGGTAMRAYEINVGAGGRDPSQDRSAAGQRVWSVLSF